jgi:ParB family transcriptional regulator, chromosome partitioning protein
LIPSAPAAPKGDRPVDVFFADRAADQRPDASDGPVSNAGTSTAAPGRDGVEPATPAEAEVSRETTVADGPELVPVPGAHFAELPIGSIDPNPRQPRQVFDEDDMAELVHSIEQVGVLQPVVVRPAPGRGGRYELIMGERRLRAATTAGLAAIPAIVRDTAENDLLRDALLENLHRSQLNALEEAAAYAQLLEDFGCTHEELAERIGRSRPQISNTLRLLKLPRPSSVWRSGSSRRACLCARWRRPSRSVATTSPSGVAGRGPARGTPSSTSWPRCCPTGSTPG